MSNKEALKKVTRDEEGWRDTTYPGPKTGKPHIAYGHLLSQEQSEAELKAMGLEDELEDWTGFTVTKEQGELLLDIDIEDEIEGLHPTKRYTGWTEDELDALDPERYIALISMAFQLGGHGVRSKFPSFVKAVKAEDWDRAADEMLWSNGLLKQKRSQWYVDSPDRAQLMSDKMRNGTIVKMATPAKAEAGREKEDSEMIIETFQETSTERLLEILNVISIELIRRKKADALYP